MENKTKQIDLTFEQNEVALILKALSRLPYGEVYTMIGKISSEVKKQMESVNPTTAPPKP